MKVYSWDDIKEGKCVYDKSAVTIGGFDGPHLGHKSLFDAVLAYSARNNVPAGIITFTHSPKAVVRANEYSGDITTVKLKLEYLESLGFDFCAVIDFSCEISKIKGSDFLDIVRKFCSMQFIAVGLDFHCGYNRDTGVAELSSYAKVNGLEFAALEEVLYENKRISSSFIRQAVAEGSFAAVNALLGRPYCVDTSSFEWRSKSSGSGLLMTANKTGTQIFPPDGEYEVCVTCADKDGHERCLCTRLYVESNFLRLEIPLEQPLTQSITRITYN